MNVVRMPDPKHEKPALLIIDIVNETLDPANHFPITPLAQQIIQPINGLSSFFRRRQWPVIFSTDDYHREDFIFSESMPPHSISGTTGAEIAKELHREETDVWLPKPRFSAFFGTNLDKRLRDWGVTLCVVTGVATHFCVITTVMDALCHDFKSILVEDATTAFTEDLHNHTLQLYRRNPLYPLLRVVSAQDLITDLEQF